MNQPVLVGWHDGGLYLEVHRPLAEDTRDLNAEAERMLASALERAGRAGAIDIDHDAVRKIAAEQRGVPLPVRRGGRSLAEYLAGARIVENDVPYEPDEQVRSVQEQARPGPRSRRVRLDREFGPRARGGCGDDPAA